MGVVSRVQVDSSGIIGWGRSPCFLLILALGFEMWERAYVDEGVLSFDGSEELRFCEFDVQVSSFQVCGYRNGYVNIFDCLCPCVW